MENEEIFLSIIHSQRKIDQMFIDTTKLKTLDQFWRLKTVIFKFGAQVKELIWESCRLTKSEVVSLLNFMPNLENLTASTWRMQQVIFEDYRENLDLLKLKKLKIKRSDPSAIQFFSDYLPKHLLSEIILQGEPDNIFTNQVTIKKVELHVDSSGATFTGDEFAELRLNYLKLKLRRYKDNLNQSIINKILKQQPILKHLDLIECEGSFEEDDESFIAVCSLNYLTTLKINIDNLSPSLFNEHFYKLSNSLTELHLESVEQNLTPLAALIEGFSRHDLVKLESLRIYFNDFGVDKTEIERMGFKFKNLTCLWIRCERPLPLDVYLTSFGNLKRIYLDYHYHREFPKLCDSYELKFPNIVDLSLHGFGYGSEDVNWNELTLLKLTEMTPNLQKFECDSNFPFNTEFIFRIMEKMKKLEIIKNWSMTQFGENYITFDGQSILDLKGIAGMLKGFSIELKLKNIDLDMLKVKQALSEVFDVNMSRIGNFFVIRMEKRHM